MPLIPRRLELPRSKTKLPSAPPQPPLPPRTWNRAGRPGADGIILDTVRTRPSPPSSIRPPPATPAVVEDPHEVGVSSSSVGHLPAPPLPLSRALRRRLRATGGTGPDISRHRNIRSVAKTVLAMPGYLIPDIFQEPEYPVEDEFLLRTRNSRYWRSPDILVPDISTGHRNIRFTKF